MEDKKFKREFVKTEFFKQMSELIDHWDDKDTTWIDNKIKEIRAKRKPQPSKKRGI